MGTTEKAMGVSLHICTATSAMGSRHWEEQEEEGMQARATHRQVREAGILKCRITHACIAQSTQGTMGRKIVCAGYLEKASAICRAHRLGMPHVWHGSHPMRLISSAVDRACSIRTGAQTKSQ